MHGILSIALEINNLEFKLYITVFVSAHRIISQNICSSLLSSLCDYMDFLYFNFSCSGKLIAAFFALQINDVYNM
jgi:hypothetical protein